MTKKNLLERGVNGKLQPEGKKKGEGKKIRRKHKTLNK